MCAAFALADAFSSFTPTIEICILHFANRNLQNVRFGRFLYYFLIRAPKSNIKMKKFEKVKKIALQKYEVEL